VFGADNNGKQLHRDQLAAHWQRPRLGIVEPLRDSPACAPPSPLHARLTDAMKIG
jgi:hypothetical protein